MATNNNVLIPGVKIDLFEIDKSMNADPSKKKGPYATAIFDVLSEDELELTMPVVQTKLILLQTGTEYEAVMFQGGSQYKVNLEVVDRYKTTNGILLVKCRVKGEIKKYQRRGYYRLKTDFDILVRAAELHEEKHLSQGEFVVPEALLMKKVHMVDISGGGIAFEIEESESFETGSYILMSMDIYRKEELIKHYDVFGKIQVSKKKETGSVIEQGVEFVGIKKDLRDDIIAFIFEEERIRRSIEKAKEDRDQGII